MASTKSYLSFILGQCADLEGISHRAMMGEYLLYFQGRLFGGIYDDRLLVKPVPAALALLPDATWETPYPGARAMLLVEPTAEKAFLPRLICAMYPQLPRPQAKKKA